MTLIERQILVNQFVIMSTLMNVLYYNEHGRQKDIDDLARSCELTHKIIEHEEQKVVKVK